jgi:hypothetical protein
MTEASARHRGQWGWRQLPVAPDSMLDFLQAEIIKYLLERREGHRVREDGVEMFKVLVQPAQDVQHKNAIGDVDTEVGEGVGEALHLLTVVVGAEVTLNEAPEGGVDVEAVGFVVAEELVLQCQLGIASHVAVMPQIYDLMTLSIWSQARTPTYVVSRSM